MSVIATAVKHLIAAGVSGDDLVCAIAEMEAAALPPAESKEERRKRISRETSARHRASRNVTKRHQEQADNGDAECHETSLGDARTSPPRAHVRDKPLDIIPLEFPPSSPSAREVDWQARLEEAKAAAGPMLGANPGLLVWRELKALVEQGCEWGEVLDAIRVVAQRQAQRRKPITSWTWVKDDALAFRDRRLAGFAEPNITPIRPGQGPPQSITDRLADENRRYRELLTAELDRRNGRAN